MAEIRRRILYSLSLVALIVVFFTLLYRWAIFNFEGVDITLFESAQTVIEALTTAGFGGDTQNWTTAPMNLLVIAMNLSGVLLVFLALPLVVIPLFQRALEDSPQESTALSDHVIICSYSPREDVLQSELEASDVPYVIVDADPETVLELNKSGVEAILGNPEHAETFEAANIEQARALVIDVSDEENVSVILTARELREDLTVVSVAENQQDAVYHRYAGADEVVRPREALGRALATKLTLSATPKLQGTIELGNDFELSELVVREKSSLAGKTLAEAQLRDRLGATVIGLWSRGEFVPAPDPQRRIEENTILLVAGSHQSLERVTAQAISPEVSGADRVVVVGYGVVGRTVAAVLDEQGVSRTVVDVVEHDGVDVTGDVKERDTLAEANTQNAQSVVLALDDDATTMYTTVALEELAPEADIIARANDVENRGKLYRAGAEYVLALSTVTGRMLSSILLEDEEVLTPETQFEIVRTAAPGLAGQTLGGAAVRNRTDATIVAIEHDGQLVTNPGPDVTVYPDDTLIVTGDTDAVETFREVFA